MPLELNVSKSPLMYYWGDFPILVPTFINRKLHFFAGRCRVRARIIKHLELFCRQYIYKQLVRYADVMCGNVS
jgi:hypothetical protein